MNQKPKLLPLPSACNRLEGTILLKKHKRENDPRERHDQELDNDTGLAYLVIRIDDRSFLIKTSTIDWIEAAGNYVRVHRGKESSLVRKPMKVIELELSTKKFIRIHRSAIVNIDRIKELQRMFHGEFKIILNSGTRLTLSRHYLKNFQRIVGGTL